VAWLGIGAPNNQRLTVDDPHQRKLDHLLSSISRKTQAQLANDEFSAQVATYWTLFNDVCYEEDFLDWLKSYRDDTDSARICQNPGLDAALSSDFPKGRYNNGLMAFLCAF
jgi:hypothetical protein